MRASGPTAWAAFAFKELFDYPAHSAVSRFGLLGGDNPADEFIAGKRRDVLPS